LLLVKVTYIVGSRVDGIEHFETVFWWSCSISIYLPVNTVRQ